jgi:hypothetical protein
MRDFLLVSYCYDDTRSSGALTGESPAKSSRVLSSTLSSSRSSGDDPCS